MEHERICPNCGLPLTQRPGERRLNFTRRKFCSSRCAWAYAKTINDRAVATLKASHRQQRRGEGCTHHWIVESTSSGGYFPAECRTCGAKAKFPMPVL